MGFFIERPSTCIHSCSGCIRNVLGIRRFCPTLCVGKILSYILCMYVYAHAYIHDAFCSFTCLDRSTRRMIHVHWCASVQRTLHRNFVPVFIRKHGYAFSHVSFCLFLYLFFFFQVFNDYTL